MSLAPVDGGSHPVAPRQARTRLKCGTLAVVVLHDLRLPNAATGGQCLRRPAQRTNCLGQQRASGA